MGYSKQQIQELEMKLSLFEIKVQMIKLKNQIKRIPMLVAAYNKQFEVNP